MKQQTIQRDSIFKNIISAPAPEKPQEPPKKQQFINDDKLMHFTTSIKKSLHKRLKQQALDEGRSANLVLESALLLYFSNKSGNN